MFRLPVWEVVWLCSGYLYEKLCDCVQVTCMRSCLTVFRLPVWEVWLCSGYLYEKLSVFRLPVCEVVCVQVTCMRSCVCSGYLHVKLSVFRLPVWEVVWLCSSYLYEKLSVKNSEKWDGELIHLSFWDELHPVLMLVLLVMCSVFGSCFRFLSVRYSTIEMTNCYYCVSFIIQYCAMTSVFRRGSAPASYRCSQQF